MLPCVAVCCSVLPCVAVCCSVLLRVAVCSKLQVQSVCVDVHEGSGCCQSSPRNISRFYDFSRVLNIPAQNKKPKSRDARARQCLFVIKCDNVSNITTTLNKISQKSAL